MNDLSYISVLSDTAILREIGEFVKNRRVDQNLTQDDVAERAAISRSTLSLLERGENVALSNLLKVLRVLESLYVLNAFKVSEPISPLQLARENEKKRKRASSSSRKNDKDNQGW